jgi:large subunit ribosomal protein L21
MFAIVRTGAKQYRVQEGDVLCVEKLNKEKGEKFTFNEVLLVEDGKKTLIGTPFVENALVKAEIIENLKDDKVIVFKKRRREQYRRLRGHRQELTRIKIEEIALGPKRAPEKPAEAVKEEKEKIAPRKPRVEAKKPEAREEKAKPLKAEKAKEKAPAKKKAAAKAAAKADKQRIKKE